MVLLSRMQLDERMRQEALLQQARKARQAEVVADGETVQVTGTPKVQSQFFMKRFGQFTRRLKLQTT